jgi:plastocyanin
MRALFIRNVILSVLFLVAILALETSNLSAPARAADATVTIDNFTFEPQRLTVKAGTTVTWANQDDIPHTVASDTKLFKSKALDTDDKFSFTFATPGVYDYFCSMHPHMTGEIVVESGKVSATGSVRADVGR